MSRKVVTVLGLALPLLMLQSAVAAEQLPPASRWMPNNAMLTLELFRPQAILKRVYEPAVTKAVTSLPAYQGLASRPQFQEFMGVVSHLEGQLGTDWKTGLGKLLGGGVTLALYPDGTHLLIIDAEDGRMLGQLHEIIVNSRRAEANRRGQPASVASKVYRGVTMWTLGGNEVSAVIGNRLLLTNKLETLKAVLDLRAQTGGASLASLHGYQEGRRAVGSKAAAMTFVNLAMVKQHPPIRKALTEHANPLAALLFAGISEAILHSNWLAVGVQAEQDTLTLQARLDGTLRDRSGPAAFALPAKPEQGVLSNLSVPRRIAGFSFYRDLKAFYTAKDKLFPERTSGLIFFENMMGIFFSGRDFTEEVLSETSPEVRFVVAEQQYAKGRTPQVQIPAFAAVFRLRHPQKFAEIAEDAWQKAVGLISFTRGQAGQPGLIIDRPIQEGTKFSMAYFPTKGYEDRTDLQFVRRNFQPAMAKVGDYWILSSTEALTRDLIDALKKEMAAPLKPQAGTDSLLELDFTRLASILVANRDTMVRQNMVNEGKTRTEAELQQDLLTVILKHLGQAKFSLGTQDSQTGAHLELKLNLP